jgi:hypothetical protein
MLRKSYDFDPVQTRESFLGHDRFLLRFMNEASIAPQKPAGEIARNRLQDALRCWLAGLEDAVEAPLPRYCNWLERAIAIDEYVGARREFHRVSLRTAYALGRWMVSGDAAMSEWRSAAAGELADWNSMERPYGPEAILEHRLEEYLAYCIQSRQFEAGMDELECRIARKRPPIKSVQTPRDYAYAVCRHHARGDYSADELFDAGRRMLQQQLSGTWLGRGHTLRAAMWLKVVYWDRDALRDRKPRLSPRQTVLQAYRNMPRVAMPDFVRIDAES